MIGLILGAIAAGVVAGMAAVAVRLDLDDGGAFTGAGPGDGPGSGFVDGDDIVAVNLTYRF